jgi:hypothetical protein
MESRKIMNFKLNFPSGYHLENILNNNLDINVILENDNVYFFTLFTLENIHYLMNKKDSESSNLYFWASDMLIVKDLKLETIQTTINDLVIKDYFDNFFIKIGNVNSVFGNPPVFGELIDCLET